MGRPSKPNQNQRELKKTGSRDFETQRMNATQRVFFFENEEEEEEVMKFLV